MKSRISIFFIALSSLVSAQVPQFDHIVVLIEENEAYSDVIGQSSAPYINSLANYGATFTNSYYIINPSQPNYLALFSGSIQGVTDNNVHPKFNAPNIARSLLDAGKTFRCYSEDLPSVGWDGVSSGVYTRKHNPSTQFTNVPADINQPFTAFPSDFSQLPSVAFVVPNNNHNMHNGSVSDGDTWAQQNISGYAQWALTHNSLLIITFDESETSELRVPTLFFGANVLTGQYADNINHYNILRTIMDSYGLAAIANAAGAPAITNAWGNSPPPPASNFSLSVSLSPNRSSAILLDGYSLPSIANIYAYLSPINLTAPTPIKFYVDNNLLSQENSMPYDLKGGNQTTANPYYPTAGTHIVSAIDKNGVTLATATFTVGNSTPPPTGNFTLSVSLSPLRSNAVSLNGFSVTAPTKIYAFLSPANLTAPVPVKFYVDGIWLSQENGLPYDLKGGTQATANPYITSSGTHTVIAKDKNGLTLATATFTVTQ